MNEEPAGPTRLFAGVSLPTFSRRRPSPTPLARTPRPGSLLCETDPSFLVAVAAYLRPPGVQLVRRSPAPLFPGSGWRPESRRVRRGDDGLLLRSCVRGGVDGDPSRARGPGAGEVPKGPSAQGDD